MANSIEITQSDQHLVGEKRSRRKKLIWGGLIAAVVIAGIIVAVVLLTGKDDKENPDNPENPTTEPSTSEEKIELNDFLTNKFSASHFGGSFINDNEIMYSNEDGVLMVYNVETRARSVLIDDEAILAAGFGYWLSPTKEFLLIGRDRESSFRHSFRAHYDVMDMTSKTVTPITIGGAQNPLQYVQWNTVGNGIVLVYNNDIYYKNSPSAEPRRITTDGSQYVSNGVPDWVYEEEVFASNCALWFSPDGNKLAYVHFDDTPVRAMTIPVYGIPGSMDYQYTQHVGILYPKAGSPNPLVTLHSVDLTTENVQLLSHPFVGPSDVQKPLLTTVAWIDNTQLVAAWMNRIQNEAFVHKCTASECTQLASIKSATGWVELMTPPLPNKDGSKVALIASQPQEGGDSFKQITLLSTTNPDTFEVLTKGKFVVTEILKWDHETDLIFYMANTEANSEYLHLYSVHATAGSTPNCLSCDVKDENNNDMTYFSASISAGTKNVVALSADGPGVPQTSLIEVTAAGKSSLGEWETNEELKKKLEHVVLPTILKDTIALDNGFSAKVKMLLPPGLDQSAAKKYPMLIEVYGGPDSNAVLDRWSIDYGTYMASQKDVIYTKIDGRGSGLRGDALMHQIYKKLGTVEVTDQTTTADALAKKYAFIDPAHIGIWGWSYGGYAAAMALAKDNNKVLKCAASVAPVTDWTYYDSIYTERYMGLPSPLENKEGYDTARLSTLATSFADKTFLLVHGTLDDNVHYQQAMALSRSLERSDIMFKQITYPDENHSLAGVRPHLYHSLTRYFSDCFGISETY